MSSVLTVENLVAGYGDNRIVKGVSLDVSAGEVAAVIGSNGSGKTTLLRAVSGLIPVQSGSIKLDGYEVTGLPAHNRVRLGLVYAPERARVAGEMTVEENLMVGAFLRKDKEGIRRTLEEVREMFPCLVKKRTTLAASLSGGERQMLVLSRALMAKPSVLLLDEPFFGLSVGMKKIFMDRLQRIRESGVTVVLTEHDLSAVLQVASRIYGFCNGRVIFSGSAEQFKQDNPIQKIYA